jgi:hypothetical protein
MLSWLSLRADSLASTASSLYDILAPVAMVMLMQRMWVEWFWWL